MFLNVDHTPDLEILSRPTGIQRRPSSAFQPHKKSLQTRGEKRSSDLEGESRELADGKGGSLREGASWWGGGCLSEEEGSQAGGGGDGGPRFLQVSFTQTFQSGSWLRAAILFPVARASAFQLSWQSPCKSRLPAPGCLAHSSASHTALFPTGEQDPISDAFPAPRSETGGTSWPLAQQTPVFLNHRRLRLPLEGPHFPVSVGKAEYTELEGGRGGKPRPHSSSRAGFRTHAVSFSGRHLEFSRHWCAVDTP